MNSNTTFCPRCGDTNNNTDTLCHGCGANLPKKASFDPNTANTNMMNPQVNTLATTNPNEDKFKILTGVFLVLGLFTPLWLVTLPLFWFLAYLSYKKDWTIYNGR